MAETGNRAACLPTIAANHPAFLRAPFRTRQARLPYKSHGPVKAPPLPAFPFRFIHSTARPPPLPPFAKPPRAPLERTRQEQSVIVMVEVAAGSAAGRAPSTSSSASGCRGGGGRGCGLALGRLVRKLRRQSRMLAATARHGHAGSSSSSSARCQQYDPLSYARNFDFGTALDGADGGYSFASRFVLAAPARRPQ
ncbi:unnamed protein product [Urochloa decumbens]|uniref:Uncharacterized protein n=1 Tax=Urochloa decumbens TaxID=240449 RepID=A0ABC9EC41_9POAL